MRIFIVHAHHEPTSFNGALTNEAVTSLGAAGHEVLVSDLYAMSFDPVSDRRNFATISDPSCLKQQNEESYASAHDGFVPELQAEMDKLIWCDALILQFPLWWLGLPAILKGWVDRVLAAGRAYGGGRYFSKGVFSSKRAMCSVTVGGAADAYSRIGAYGPMAPIFSSPSIMESWASLDSRLSNLLSFTLPHAWERTSVRSPWCAIVLGC